MVLRRVPIVKMRTYRVANDSVACSVPVTVGSIEELLSGVLFMSIKSGLQIDPAYALSPGKGACVRFYSSLGYGKINSYCEKSFCDIVQSRSKT